MNKRNDLNLSQLFNAIQDIDLNFIRMRNVEENEELSLTPEMMADVQRQINEYQDNRKMGIVLSKETQTDKTDNANLPCIAHSLRALILANGNVMMCAKRRHDPICIGNINEQDFCEIWTSERRIEASKKLREEHNQIGCAVCRITKYNELFYYISQVKSANFV